MNIQVNKNNRKVAPAKLPRNVYRALEDIVGPRWVSEDRAFVETYSKFILDIPGMIRKHVKDPTALPACVVLPESTDQVKSIVKVCYRYQIPLIPFTNGQFGCGTTSPNPTVILHMSRMNKILDIDEENLTATLQAYVDYGQLQAEAMKRNLWNGGTPGGGCLCKIASQFASLGYFYTSSYYEGMQRNVVSAKVVLSDGEILRLGSESIAGISNFYDRGPGPDLTGLIRGSLGTSGIITEITVKLHTWLGESSLPEVPAGRPSLIDYQDAKYDTVPDPKRYKTFWIEFPDLDSETNAIHEIGYSEIALGVNCWSKENVAVMCSQTHEQAIARLREGFIPTYLMYVVIAGLVSEKQLEYEEKVLRQIVKENDGIFLSKEYKPEVLEALSPWNFDWLRTTSFFRATRKNFYPIGEWFTMGIPNEVGPGLLKLYREGLKSYDGELSIIDLADGSPNILNVMKGGRFCFAEALLWPSSIEKESLEVTLRHSLKGLACMIANKLPTGISLTLGGVEPITSFFPEVGPNTHILMRKFRKVLDPRSIFSPGRQVYTEEELKAVPEMVEKEINEVRSRYNLKSVVKNK